MKRILLTLFLIAPIVLSAQAGGTSSNPCIGNWCCGSFEGGAELLYLRPSLCDLDYAIVDERTIEEIVDTFTEQGAVLPIGKQHSIDCHYQWGFRVFVGYVNECTCFDVRAQYTWLHDRETAKPNQTSSSVIWETFGQPRFFKRPLTSRGEPDPVLLEVAAKARNHYDAVDVEVGMRKMVGCNLWVRGFLGLRYIDIDHTFQAFYKGFTPFPLAPTDTILEAVVTDHRNVWAIGPKLGVEGIYDVACGFGVGGRATVGIAAGSTHGKFTQEGERFRPQQCPPSLEINLQNRYGDKCEVIPFVDMRLGINYTWCCSCFTFIAEFGYEFISYINAIPRQTFNDKAATASTDCQSYNLDGFYLSARVTL